MAEMNGKPFYSFEYFPPKTPAGKLPAPSTFGQRPNMGQTHGQPLRWKMMVFKQLVLLIEAVLSLLI